MTDTTPPANDSLDDFLGVQPDKPWKKWAVRGGIGVALLLVVLLLSRCFAGSEEPNYSTRTVRKGDLTVTVSATGNLKPINQVDVGSEQSGIMTHVYVDVNDRVTKGQVLAELDRARLQDTVNQSRAQVAAAQAGVAQAQAQASFARATLSRQENVFQLSGGRVPAKTELDSARATYQQAVAGVHSSQAQVQVANAQLSSALTNLSKTRILSPVTGVVLSRSIEPGQTVAASFNAPVLFAIAEDLTKMEVEVSVDEADVGQVANGQPATFTVDAFPGQTFPALVNRVNVGSNASSTSSSSSTTSSTAATVVAYTAVLSVNNDQQTLRPGMTATADIVTRQLQDVLLVPNAALRFKPQAAKNDGGITSQLMGPRRRNRAARSVSFGAGSRQTVYIVGEDGKPKAAEVVVGESDGSRTVIRSGDLKAGAKVITGQLAAGQTAPEEREDGERSGRRSGERRPGGGDRPQVPAPAGLPTGNATEAAPAPAPAAAPSAKADASAPTPRAPAAATQADRPRMRDMTPEHRRAYMESLTPEQREEMRQRREARRAEREAAGADGE